MEILKNRGTADATIPVVRCFAPEIREDRIDQREPNPWLTLHYTGWFIGILVVVYYNPYIIG